MVEQMAAKVLGYLPLATSSKKYLVLLPSSKLQPPIMPSVSSDCDHGPFHLYRPPLLLKKKSAMRTSSSGCSVAAENAMPPMLTVPPCA